MSSNQRNQNYIFRNKKLSKDEYNKAIIEENLNSYDTWERLKKEYEDIKNINKLNENLAGSATREAANFKMLLRMFYSALIEIYTESFYNLQKELQIKYPGLNDSELNKIIDENYTLKKMQGIIRDLKPLYDE